MNTDQQRILDAKHHDPFGYLGMHQGDGCVIVRAFHPDAKLIKVVADDDPKKIWMMQSINDSGLFEVEIEERKENFGYQLEFGYNNGDTYRCKDPYCFLPQISEYDRHLFNEGNHYHIYDRLGAHVTELGGVKGVLFGVWAPSAQRVSVVGDFCNWDGRVYQMRALGGSGVWEIFIPGLTEGTIYKFEIRGPQGEIFLKADPHGFFHEVRPDTGSIIYDINGYEWGDAEFMDERARKDYLHEPMSVYECHLGSWMRVPDTNGYLTYGDLAPRLAEHVKGLGFTHIELMPVAEHPFDQSWGYQVTGFFAPTSRFGTPKEFMAFVDYLHREGIGVIVDWVPAHFPRDAHGLGWFDGSALYEHSDPRQGEHRDWGTKIFNYGRHEVRNFLLSNALFWLQYYHIDGLRVDAVASMLYLDYSREDGEWVPNQYGGRENLDAINLIKQMNQVVHELHPGVLTIAEESTSWPSVSRPTYVGGLGFSLKWNMGWMNDILSFFEKDSIYRRYHHDYLTFAMLYAFHENFTLPLSHDEVVHGKKSLLAKMPGDMWQQFANLRLLYGYMYAQPGKKLLFQGAEIGQWNEWDCTKSIDWHLAEYRPHWAVMRYLARLNHLHRTEPALYYYDFEEEGFGWIDFQDTDNNVLAFMRKSNDPDDYLICVFNCTPIPREGYSIGVPEHCLYREILNSDSEDYWGSNMGNAGAVHSEATPWHNQPNRLIITVPPLGVLYFKPERT